MSLSSQWKKSSVANIVRYRASAIYFARVRIGGKSIRQILCTPILEVAKARLATQQIRAASGPGLELEEDPAGTNAGHV
jgi:hypothetical protein